jgi:hypothetical protein
VGGAAGHRRGQGIDTVTAALSHQVTLTECELQTLAFRLGIHDLPVVLAVRPRHATVDSRDAATNRATQELVSRNLIVDDQVHPDLVSVLQALQRPDRELAMRLVTPDGTARVSAVRRGSRGVLARRIGDDISLRTVGESGELRDMAGALLAELPQAKPAEIHPVGAPLLEMSECLSGTHDSVGFADRIRALGAESKAAMLLGAALASRQAFAEIVHYALADDEGRISRSPAAVGVFYTKRGRIVGAPSASPSGQLWATLKAGSDHAVVDAIGQLVGLANDEWGGVVASAMN